MSVLSSLGMFGNGATMEAFREFEVLWWVLLDDYLAGLKKNLLRVAGGADHQQDPNNTFGSLNVREPGHHGGLQGIKSVMLVPVEGPFTVSKK